MNHDDAGDYAGIPAAPLDPAVQLHRGDTVYITSAEAGTSRGEVLEVAAAADLPAIPGFDPRIVAEALAQKNVREVAILTHEHEGRPVMFVALGDGRGHWEDLRGAVLWIRRAAG